MPRVKTLTARKAYPEAGIAPGDTYYLWQFYRGRPHRSKTYPKPSQLTQNEVIKVVLEAYEGDTPTEADDIRTMAETVREAGQEAEGKYDNLPEPFQQSEQGERLEAQASACEEAADALDEIADRVEAAKSAIEEVESGDKARNDALTEDFVTDDLELDVDAIREEVSGTQPELD